MWFVLVIPPCRNPDHPSDSPRTKGMIVVQQTNREVVFACETCRDAKKILSVQVVTLGHGWNAERELHGLPRANQVQKTPVGKIKYFR